MQGFGAPFHQVIEDISSVTEKHIFHNVGKAIIIQPFGNGLYIPHYRISCDLYHTRNHSSSSFFDCRKLGLWMFLQTIGQAGPHPGTFEKLVFRLTSCQSLCSMTCKVAAAARVFWAGDHIRHIPARRNCKDERSPPVCQGLGGCFHWGESLTDFQSATEFFWCPRSVVEIRFKERPNDLDQLIHGYQRTWMAFVCKLRKLRARKVRKVSNRKTCCKWWAPSMRTSLASSFEPVSRLWSTRMNHPQGL